MGTQAGELGTVVGFTSDQVEVKFETRIARCSAAALELCDGFEQNKAVVVPSRGIAVPDANTAVESRRKCARIDAVLQEAAATTATSVPTGAVPPAMKEKAVVGHRDRVRDSARP